MRGRDVVLGCVTLTLLVVSLDLLLTGALSFFFDICIVPIALMAALAVRPRDFFGVAVLPPLLVQPFHAVHTHPAGEKLFLQANDKDRFVFQSLRGVNGHQRHDVAILIFFVTIKIREQRDIL